MALTYYLTVDGIVGDSTRVDHEGAFTILDYSFDASAIVSAATGGGSGAAEPSFAPLTVDLELNAGLTELLRGLAASKHIRAIELKGVSTDATGGMTVYDLKLGNVTLTTFHDTSSGHDMLAFTYQQVSLTTTPRLPNGNPGTPAIFSWDLVTSRPDVDIPDPVVPDRPPSGGSGAHAYYLTLDGIVGDSARVGHEGAFTILDYSFDASAIVSAATGGGSGAYEPSFAPLTVDLELNAGLTELLRDLALGRHIRAIELKGVSTDATGGMTVYDLKLGDVTLTTFHDTSSGHDMLAFSYQQVSLTTTPRLPNGNPGTPAIFSWNLVTSRPDVDIPDPVVPDGPPSGGSGAAAYYLTLDGIVGDSTRVDHEGAFTILDYSFDASAIVSAATGGGVFEPSFAPLTVDLELNAGLTELLRGLAASKHFRAIELKGVSTDATGGMIVYDLKLGSVSLTTFHDTSSGHDMLAFTYQQVSLTTTSRLPDGSAGTPATFSWDLVTSRPDVDIPAPVVPDRSPSGGSGAAAYYLTIDGIVGDSTRVGHEGAFTILDYSFDASAIVSTATGGGSGASEPSFAPLTVDLELNAGLTELLRDLALGRHIRAIELKGVSTDATGGMTVYDLKLGDVTLTTFHDTSSGHDMLAFTYQQVSLTTTSRLPDGSAGTPAIFSWDLVTSRPDVDIPDPVVPDRSPIAEDDAVTATTGIGGTADGNVLANDSDPDGDPLTVTPFVGTGSHGDLILRADGSFSYTVTNLAGPTGSHLHDVFSYTETDGRGGTASANLDVTLNRAPDVLDNIAGVKVGATSSGNVLGNDTDPDGDQLTVTAVNGGSVGTPIDGAYGTLVLNSNGSYTYTATRGAPSQTALDVFRFAESDAHGGVVQSTLTFTIISNGQSYLAGTPGETVTGGNGKGVLDGALGGQHLIGGNGADVLIGGNGDILTGGNGPDRFVFTGDFGRNEITDFSRADALQLDKSAFGSVKDILTHYASDDGHGNTVIVDPHNPANMIILDHVSLNQLRASDLVLV